MIETKVPMDVRAYKAKLIGPFTTRQLICGVISAILDVVLIFTVVRPMGIGIQTAIMGLVLVDVPILAFILEPLGMPMESYLKHVLLRSLIVPTKRKAISQVPLPKDTVYSDKDLKRSQKAMKKAAKTHPEFRAYK